VRWACLLTHWQAHCRIQPCQTGFEVCHNIFNETIVIFTFAATSGQFDIMMLTPKLQSIVDELAAVVGMMNANRQSAALMLEQKICRHRNPGSAILKWRARLLFTSKTKSSFSQVPQGRLGKAPGQSGYSSSRTDQAPFLGAILEHWKNFGLTITEYKIYNIFGRFCIKQGDKMDKNFSDLLEKKYDNIEKKGVNENSIACKIVV
jgi:hypothetical protein